MRFTSIARLRRAATRWRLAVAVTCNAILCEAGARIGLPGVDGTRVQHFFHTAHPGLLTLYNFLVGGAVSRAAILALGGIPYLQAHLYVWLARAGSSDVRRLTDRVDIRRAAVRLTTIGIALVQSFGFARFLERIPGAVADPGLGFVGRTILLVTGGAIAVGWLGENIHDAVRNDAEMSNVVGISDQPSIEPTQNSSPTLAGPSILAEQASAPLLEAGPISELSTSNAAARHELDPVRYAHHTSGT